MWNCLCDCGNIKPVRAGALKSGNTTSCGCAHSEEVRERMTRHGMKHTRLYRIWQGMLRRCDNPKRKDFKDYGGRGITVCEEWKKCFTAFRDWSLSNGYRDDLTIDRVNNNEMYSPENCRWVDMETQNKNKRHGENPYRDAMTGRYTTKAGMDLENRDV